MQIEAHEHAALLIAAMTAIECWRHAGCPTTPDGDMGEFTCSKETISGLRQEAERRGVTPGKLLGQLAADVTTYRRENGLDRD